MLASAGNDHYEQAVILNLVFGSLACLSFALLLWQWIAARRFPLHQRVAGNFVCPPVTLLKSLKGCDAETENCLRSWFTQQYPGAVQILFGLASADDPVCKIVHQLLREFPNVDAQLVVCENLTGANAKVSKLAQLAKLAKHDVLVISDADVRVAEDFLVNAVPSISKESNSGSAESANEVGLVNCFYRLANPTTLAMRWEAVAINADFWSQVLQSKSLKPLDFALGAVMVTHRKYLDEIGGFESLKDCLADDYQLGHRIAKKGHRIELCHMVVECWHSPQSWREVWKHQLRWARTIRVCQPVPYFFSILSNATLWPLLWLLAALPVTVAFNSGAGTDHNGMMTTHIAIPLAVVAAIVFIAIRIFVSGDLQRRLMQSRTHGQHFWLAPFKDLLQVGIWLGAFIGNTIEWRGQKFTLKPDGSLVKK